MDAQTARHWAESLNSHIVNIPGSLTQDLLWGAVVIFQERVFERKLSLAEATAGLISAMDIAAYRMMWQTGMLASELTAARKILVEWAFGVVGA